MVAEETANPAGSTADTRPAKTLAYSVCRLDGHCLIANRGLLSCGPESGSLCPRPWKSPTWPGWEFADPERRNSTSTTLRLQGDIIIVGKRAGRTQLQAAIPCSNRIAN